MIWKLRKQIPDIQRKDRRDCKRQGFLKHLSSSGWSAEGVLWDTKVWVVISVVTQTIRWWELWHPACRYPGLQHGPASDVTLLKDKMPFQPIIIILSSVLSLSRVRLPTTPWTAACQASLSITNSRNPPKPMSIKSMMPSNHLTLCHPLLLLLLPSFFPVFSFYFMCCYGLEKHFCSLHST